MYHVNTKGPWPIIDVSSSVTALTTNSTVTGAGSPLNAFLTTANLGSKSEAYTRITHMPGTPITVTAGQALSYGVCLQPLNNINDDIDNVYVDVSAFATARQNESAIAWIGFLDGSSPVAGWNAANVVTNWHPISSSPPSGVNHIGGSIVTQVLLRDVVNGSVDLDSILCVGISLTPYGTTGFGDDHQEVVVSARYGISSLGSEYKGF